MTRWMDQGSCVPIGQDEWFGPDGETGINAGKRTRRNQDVCGTCPVRVECGGYALETRTSSGVFAGFDLDKTDGRKELKAWVAAHTPRYVDLPAPRRVTVINLSDHPQAVKARSRRARLEAARRDAAAEASA